MHGKLNGWVVVLLLSGVMAYAIAEEITLTTYYPSPRGVYDQLRTAGNVQIGRIDPPAVAAEAPRLHVVRRNADTDPADTGFPALLVEDEIPNAGLPDPTPFVIDENGNVGIGTMGPLSEKLEVAGGIRLGGALANIPGTIQWTGTAFQMYDGTRWKNFGTVIRQGNNPTCDAGTGFPRGRVGTQDSEFGHCGHELTQT